MNQTDTATSSTGQPASRRSLRVPYSRDRIPVALLGADGAKSEVEVTGRNIGKGGIGALLEGHVERGTRCEVEMQSLTGQTSRHPALIIFTRPVRGDLHEIGIAFDDLIDLEAYVTLQRVQRMIYEKEKKADRDKAERILAHASAPSADHQTHATKGNTPTPRSIVSQLANQSGRQEQVSAYVSELAQRTTALSEAAAQSDRQAMHDLTQWVIDTAQDNGFPTLFAVANAVITYLEDDQDDLDLARGQVNELIGYLSRARASA